MSTNKDLVAKIEYKLSQGLSSELIAGRFKLEYEETVCFKTIYRGIESGYFKSPKKDLLVRKGKKYKQKNTETRGKIKNTSSIDERSLEANERLKIGHIESDTIVGKSHKSAIATHVCRKSRYLFAKLMPNRKAETMSKTTQELFSKYKNSMIKSFTNDNGKEFSKHEEVDKKLNTNSYFAHPYHSWKRGTNENTNGLLRRYFPKGTDFTKLTIEEVDKVVDILNNRPRKVLGFRTPKEVFEDELKSCT